MTHMWQRRAASTLGLVALLGVAMLLVVGPGAHLHQSLPGAAVTLAAPTDHSAFVALPESRPTFAFVETLTLLGLGMIVLAGLIDHHSLGTLTASADGVVRQRRWRARLVGAPPFLS
jgi:hypothetical protein